MKTTDTTHPAQVAILHVLLFRPSASFAQLQKASKLSSDHFSFHLKKMLDKEVIAKDAASRYVLTPKGKEYANQFDTDARKVEKQPKVAVLLLIEHEDGRLLCQQRLKQPYYGFWGRPTGKVQFGESILTAGARELMEETGLEADLSLKEVYHKLDYNRETEELLEAKLFFVLHGTNARGELLEEFEGGRNAWMTLSEVHRQDKVFDGLEDAYRQIGASHLGFTESKHYYAPTDY